MAGTQPRDTAGLPEIDPAVLAAAAKRLTEQVSNLVVQQGELGKKLDLREAQVDEVRRVSRWQTRIIALLLLFIVGMGYAIQQTHVASDKAHTATQKAKTSTQNNEKFAKCIADVLNQSTQRTNLLVPLSNVRTKALGDVFKSLALPQNEVEAAFTKAAQAYRDADDAYNKAAAANPPPAAPQVTCK